MFNQDLDCVRCKNKGICKYISEMEEIQAGVEDIESEEISPYSPIEVRIICSGFQREGIPLQRN